MSNIEPDPPLHVGPFAGVEVFAQLVRDAVARAARENWPLMVWSDPNYRDWPLRERAVVESLQQWAGSGKHLVLLAAQYDDVRRYHPRFVSWRSTWDHIIECRVCTGLDASEVPSALWSSGWVMRRLDLVRSTGIAGNEAQRRALLKEELDECRRQSGPGFSATTLGL
jgi:hypothetical protein